MFKGIGGDVLGQMLETGKAAAKQAKQISPVKIAKTAVGQVTGSVSRDKDAIEAMKAGAQSGSSSASDKSELPNINQLRQKDNSSKSRKLEETRLQLEKMKIHRYQKLQQDILEEERKREQEIPAYEVGKPGAARTMEEKAELIGEQRKQQEEEEGKVIAQPTPKQSRGMGIFGKVRSKKGTKELGKKMLG